MEIFCDMFVYNDIFRNDDEIRLFVENSEKNYKNQVLEIADEISDMTHIKFLTLSGPTCSGKTTTSYILENEFEKRGLTVKIISIDDFYRNRADISKDEKPDFESISAIDFETFKSCVNQILNGETAMLPMYDFKKGERQGFFSYTPVEHEIIIFEGIQAIYPEILSILPKEFTKSIYISVESDVEAYGMFFEKREIRFYRRLLRDFLFRSATPERTLELWQGVVENEENNIIPNEKYADYVINSFLPYELGVIKPYLMKVISFDFSKKYEKELYEQICSEFKNIIEIPSRFIPSDSVFREFIGNES